jgi:tRNA threonylcarbamoyladenosine biosynthesis protein TsaB
MKLLIESSTPVAVVAVISDQVTVTQQAEHQKHHSKYLLGMIDRVLKEANVSLNELTEVIVGEGPGSYTGARIAVTIAKMFALQLNIPLFSFDSLSLFATNQGPCAVHIPLKRSTVLGGLYDLTEGKIIQSATYFDANEWEELTLGWKVIHPATLEFGFHELQLHNVNDISSFSPNYAREWKPT